MNEKMQNVLKNVFTCICMAAPVLVIYNTGGLIWLIWGLVFTLPFSTFILWKKENIKIEKEMILLILYLAIYACIAIIKEQNILSLMQNILLLIVIAVFMPNLFNCRFGMNFYKVICIFSTIFVFLQLLVAKKFQYYISGSLPIGNSKQTLYAEEMNAGGILWQPVRPRGIFNEPSGHGIYVALLLVLLLWFQSKMTIKMYTVTILLSLGLLCARSSTGILLMSLAWLGFYVKNIFKGKVNTIWIIFTLVLVFGVGIVLTTESFQVFLQHTFSSGSGGTNGRIAGYRYVFDIENYSWIELIFGHGVVYDYGTSLFLAGWARIMYQFGITGIGVYAMLLICYWNKGNKMQKAVILVLFLQCFFAMAMYSVDVIWWWGVYFSVGEKESVLTKHKDRIILGEA